MDTSAGTTALIADIDWNAVGAIGQWFGGLASLAAVIVALYLARSSTRTLVRVSASARVIVPPGEEVMVFDVTNLGQTPVYIREISIHSPDGETRGIFPSMAAQMPLTLQPGQRWTEHVPIGAFRNAIGEIAQRPGRWMTVQALDTTGRTHSCRLPKPTTGRTASG
jgi:hypothetical protein